MAQKAVCLKGWQLDRRMSCKCNGSWSKWTDLIRNRVECSKLWSSITLIVECKGMKGCRKRMKSSHSVNWSWCVTVQRFKVKWKDLSAFEWWWQWCSADYLLSNILDTGCSLLNSMLHLSAKLLCLMTHRLSTFTRAVANFLTRFCNLSGIALQ